MTLPKFILIFVITLAVLTLFLNGIFLQLLVGIVASYISMILEKQRTILIGIVASYISMMQEKWRIVHRFLCEELKNSTYYTRFIQPIPADFFEELKIIRSSSCSKQKWFYIWQMIILFAEYAVAFAIAVLQATIVLVVDKLWRSTK